MEIVSGGEIGCVELRVVIVGKVTTLGMYGVLPGEQELNTKNLIMMENGLGSRVASWYDGGHVVVLNRNGDCLGTVRLDTLMGDVDDPVTHGESPLGGRLYKTERAPRKLYLLDTQRDFPMYMVNIHFEQNNVQRLPLLLPPFQHSTPSIVP
jgi:hypothetical protein